MESWESEMMYVAVCVNIFNKKTTNSSRSNSRPKPSLSAPPICGLNCRCCRLEVTNGEKVRRQTKSNTKESTRKTHEITQMLQVFLNPRDKTGRHRKWRSLRMSPSVQSAKPRTKQWCCVFACAVHMWPLKARYMARWSWGLGFLTFQLACPTPRFPRSSCCDLLQ